VAFIQAFRFWHSGIGRKQHISQVQYLP